MKFSGRFDFWRVLLLSGMITPPPMSASLWRYAWWFFVMAALAFTAWAVEVGNF